MDALSRDELLLLLVAAKKKRLRDWVMFLLAYWHGLRVTEVVGGWLKRKVDGKESKVWYPGITRGSFADGYLTVQRLKGSKKTTQPLMTHSHPLLDERFAVEEFLAASKETPGTRLFPISRIQFFRLMRIHGTSAGLPAHKLYPHVLKHSIAMTMITEAGIENTRQYLGHKSGASTMEYLKASDQEASAALARVEEKRETTSEADRLAKLERVTVAESLRRALRVLEQADTNSGRKTRKMRS